MHVLWRTKLQKFFQYIIIYFVLAFLEWKNCPLFPHHLATLEEIHPDKSLLQDGLGLDSIDLLELVVNLEKKYGFKLRNDEQGQIALSSLRSLAEYTLKLFLDAT